MKGCTVCKYARKLQSKDNMFMCCYNPPRVIDSVFDKEMERHNNRIQALFAASWQPLVGGDEGCSKFQVRFKR